MLLAVSVLGLLVGALFGPILLVRRNLEVLGPGKSLEVEVNALFELIRADVCGAPAPEGFGEPVLVLTSRERLGRGRADELTLYTTHTAGEEGVALVAYRLDEGGDLLRYELPSSFRPARLTEEALRSASPQVLLSGVEEVSFEVRASRGSMWQRGYSERFPPAAFRVSLRVRGLPFERAFRVPVGEL